MKAVGCEFRTCHDRFGTLPDDADTPVDADTLFAIASLTKSFTTIALFSAIPDAPSLTLDTPVQNILREFAFPPAKTHYLITLRTLLDHTSTLPVDDPVSAPDPTDETPQRLQYREPKPLDVTRYLRDHLTQSLLNLMKIRTVLANLRRASRVERTGEGLASERTRSPLSPRLQLRLGPAMTCLEPPQYFNGKEHYTI